ncbi:hypothetical protein H6P81_018730 [Aristolochia fimbriata]|uniref:Amine oxidase domain-containing protein n=1 Tax=Aristolochia fimbriata TaxID=158543 RepID=A0AAV7E533_ARIFI|nr:hypothetical protein H6P81_018730 [Aristolochia fimbriata]
MISASYWAVVRPPVLVAHPYYRDVKRRALVCRAEAIDTSHESGRKKVVVVGTGWAGLAAAHHLSKQEDVSVTMLDAGCPDEVGTSGFWYPYRNIFSLVDELGIRPFTNWTRSAKYSPEGLEVELPIYGDCPRLPAPFGALAYTQFRRLPVVDQLTSLPLMAAVVDFDNTDVAWRKYDPITARELFKQYGCSERLYQEAFNPILQVGLFAPAEQCSAAAALGMLYYFLLAHQKDFDVKWCRGTVNEKIFEPWVESMKLKNCQFHKNKTVIDFALDEETGGVSEVICGRESYPADAVILALGVSHLQEIVKKSSVLKTKQEFLNVMNLAAIDVVSVRMRLDRRIYIPKASNACFGFDESSGWTFFDLNAIYDEYKDEPVTVVAADFYYANQLLPLTDEQIVSKAKSYLSKCVKEFEDASVMQQEVFKYPKSVTHFFPGSYKYMMRGSTSFPNFFMAGDWIINRHGSWSQEKAYVSGLEAANRVVDYFGEGEFARIIPVEEDEPHIQALRNLNRSINEIRAQIPFSDFFLQ